MDWQARILPGIRILSAITTDNREPKPADAISLRELAESDDERSMPLDELACAIIRRETQWAHRANAAGASASVR